MGKALRHERAKANPTPIAFASFNREIQSALSKHNPTAEYVAKMSKSFANSSAQSSSTKQSEHARRVKKLSMYGVKPPADLKDKDSIHKNRQGLVQIVSDQAAKGKETDTSVVTGGEVPVTQPLRQNAKLERANSSSQLNIKNGDKNHLRQSFQTN